jgi:chromate transporter
MSDHPLLTLIIVVAPLSLLAIGGASSIYAPLQHQVVDVHQWFSGREFIEMFAIARVTPGPGSMLATIVGWRIAGWAGALTATIALYLPCTLLCYFVARAWSRYRGSQWHSTIENGLRPIAAGLMIAGGVMILRVEDFSAVAWSLALGCTVLLTLRPSLHPFILLVSGAAIFVAIHFISG